MIDSERQSIFYKLLITILSVYGLYLMLSIVRDKNNIQEKIKKSIFKTKSIEYIFLFLSLFMLVGDYTLNDDLTHHEKRDIFHIIHLSVIVTLTALFAHLDMFVLPAMVAIVLWLFSA